MPEKCDRSGSTLSAKPCSVTHCRTRMPIAAILSSKPSPLSGRRTQTPTRSSRRSPRTLKAGKRADDPFLDGGNEAAHVGRAALEIEHDIADPLAGTVIGELAAASGGVNRKARLDQFGRPRRRAGGVERQGARAARPARPLAPRAIASARAVMAASAAVVGHRPIAHAAIRPAERRLEAKARLSGRRAC